MDKSEEICLLALTHFLVFLVGFLFAFVFAYTSFGDEAFKKGKAEYYLYENNERQWRWKE